MYCDKRVAELQPIVSTIPREALKIIAQESTSEINLRCACLDELCLRPFSRVLEKAVEECDWIEKVQDRCERKSDMWWYAEDCRFHAQRRVDYLKFVALRHARTEEQIQYIEDL
jgi:hypothetical protein